MTFPRVGGYRLPSRRLAGAFALLGFLPLGILTYSSLTLAERAVHEEVNARVTSVALSASTTTAEQLSSLGVTLAAFASRPRLAAAMGDTAGPR